MSTAFNPAPAPGSGMVAPGHVLGRYELLIPVAAGGMAMVWAARLKGSRGFQKIVAVKTMLPKLSDDVQFEQMFLDEASLASQIRHPYVVEILDLGEQDGVMFLVMEWIDGVPLNQLMKAAKLVGGMPFPVAVRITMQACAGLHAAHELRDAKGQLIGLVHRDVSPQNLLVTAEGVTKIVDFGVAKATAIGGGATSAGQIKGKVGYMAPEQIEGDSIDRRADVFAIGIVLYALTTGKHPFRRESDAATMYNICSPQPVLAPRKFIPDYPETLERVLLRALAKSPADRYQTANDLLRALDYALPVGQRANTDEDVAEFVRRLVGDKLEERRSTLRDALARADLNASARLADITSMPNSPSVSMIGTADSVYPTRGSSQTTWSPAARKRRAVLAVGALVLVAGAGSALTALFTAGDEATQPPPSAPSVPSRVEVPSAAPAMPGPALTQAPAEVREPEPAPKAAESAAPVRPLAPALTPKPAPKKPDWKHDPGF